VTEAPAEKPAEALANTEPEAPKQDDPVPAAVTAAPANVSDAETASAAGGSGWILWLILTLILLAGILFLVSRRKKK